MVCKACPLRGHISQCIGSYVQVTMIGTSWDMHQKTVIFCCPEEETAGAVVLEIGYAGIGHGLAVGRFLTRSLHISEESVGMYAVVFQRVPCTVAHGTVVLGLEQAVVDAPCHAVKEER